MARVSAMSNKRRPAGGWIPQPPSPGAEGQAEAPTAPLSTPAGVEPPQTTRRLPSRPVRAAHQTLADPDPVPGATAPPRAWVPGDLTVGDLTVGDLAAVDAWAGIGPAAEPGSGPRPSEGPSGPQPQEGPSAPPSGGRLPSWPVGPSSPWTASRGPVSATPRPGVRVATAVGITAPNAAVGAPTTVGGVEPITAPVPEPDIAAALGQDLPLDLGLDSRTSVLERWKAGRTDPGRRGVVALAAVAALAVALTAFVMLRGRPEAVTAPEITTVGVPVGESAAPGVEPTGDIVVSVGGKVTRPGVVTLPAGARVNDAVQAAGGPTEPDAVGLLNLARQLVDGEQVLVGVEPAPGVDPGPAGVPGDSPIDLNAADAASLESLSGVGPVLAERIVAWREEHGRFTSVDQLREVSGIGEAKFGAIKDAVRV